MDGDLLNSDSEEPYHCREKDSYYDKSKGMSSYDTRKMPDGHHKLSCHMYDKDNNLRDVRHAHFWVKNTRYSKGGIQYS